MQGILSDTKPEIQSQLKSSLTLTTSTGALGFVEWAFVERAFVEWAALHRWNILPVLGLERAP